MCGPRVVCGMVDGGVVRSGGDWGLAHIAIALQDFLCRDVG